MYYDMIKLLINACDILVLKPVTCVSAIDLLDRYLANHVIDEKRSHLLIATCLLLTSKLMEMIAPDPDDIIYIFNSEFTDNELMNMELTVLDRMKYIISSCEIDEYAYRIRRLTEKKGDIKVVYPILLLMYEMMADINLYPGGLSYDDLSQYLEIAIENSYEQL